MYSISPELYRQVTGRLSDAIGDGDYFSGSLDFVFGPVSCRLVVTVIVYRARVVLPEGERRPVADVVPVWWEFRTDAGEGPTDNDFSFSELKAFLL